MSSSDMPSFSQEQVKKWLYILAAGLIALSCILGLATLTQKGNSDTRVDWVFGLTFLSVPFLIYNGLTPHYPRAQRFSNPYAHATVDILLLLLWLSAWTLLASYVSSGKGCADFTHGSATKCRLATANTIFGAVIMLCFLSTVYFSLRAVMVRQRDTRAIMAYNRGGNMGIAFPARQASFGRSTREIGKEGLRSTSQSAEDVDVEEQEEAFDHRVGELNPYQQIRDLDETIRVDGRPVQLQIHTTPARIDAAQPEVVYDDYARVSYTRPYDERSERERSETGYYSGTGWPTSTYGPLDREEPRR